ncbi:hypothetical protein CF336_g5218 [Tilletia laevis]|nr:hypothetical protein CF336_g5218 [Tilletia laevis]
MFYARHLLLLPLLLLLPIGAVAAPLPLPETSSLSGPNLSQAPNLEVRAGAGDLPGVHPIILRLSALQHDFDIHRGNYYRLQDALGRSRLCTSAESDLPFLPNSGSAFYTMYSQIASRSPTSSRSGVHLDQVFGECTHVQQATFQ